MQAGFVRFRPVLMTALAMIIGMAPMAVGLGEGGEQNAPLGRAVVGAPQHRRANLCIAMPRGRVMAMFGRRSLFSLPERR